MVIIGRVTKDAVVNHLKDERKVVNFTIAVNDYYKPKGREMGVTCTTYFTCAYWINPGIAEKLTKGGLVEVEGRISVNAYTSLNGDAKATLNVHVNSIKIHQKGGDKPVTADTKKAIPADEVTDDLPF